MRYPLANVSAAGLKPPDVISAIDPRQPAFSQQAWGQDVLSPFERPTPPHLLQVVQVEIDSTTDADMQALLRLVEGAKGRLPQEAQALKK